MRPISLSRRVSNDECQRNSASLASRKRCLEIRHPFNNSRMTGDAKVIPPQKSLALIGNASGADCGGGAGSRSEAFSIKASDNTPRILIVEITRRDRESGRPLNLTKRWQLSEYRSAEYPLRRVASVAFVRDHLLRRFDVLAQDFVQQKQVGQQRADMNGSI